MAKKWLDSIEKQKRRSNVCDIHTDRRAYIHTYRQSQRQKNNRLLTRRGDQQFRILNLGKTAVIEP